MNIIEKLDELQSFPSSNPSIFATFVRSNEETFSNDLFTIEPLREWFVDLFFDFNHIFHNMIS